MNIRSLLLFSVLSAGQICAVAQKEDLSVPHTMNLQQAVQMALEHNHDVRISSLKVEEEKQAKQLARSAYLPVLNNHSTFAHATDSQFIAIPSGSLGTVAGIPIPSHTLVVNQGGLNFAISDTNLTQPVTELFKIKASNDAARADVEASEGKARSVSDQVELNVRQLYYKILIVQSQQKAIQSRIHATEDLQSERVQQVKYGSTLEADLVESRAQSLQAKQDLLTAQLQLSDLQMQFNDAVGIQIQTNVVLDPDVPAPPVASSRDSCIKLALNSNPDIAAAKAELEKADAGAREAKREYIPDVEAFAHYTYADNVPFLARNYGTFGVHFSYDIFDGGKKRATLRERDSQVAMAKENLARVRDQAEVKVETAYDRLEQTEQMVAVSQELLAARQEARRVSAQGLERGTYLRSQAEAAVAQESEAQTQLLQSKLEYAQAQDELNEAIGQSANE
jgi:outer membrane protein TolC